MSILLFARNNKVDRFYSLNSTKSRVFGFQNMFNLLGPNLNFPIWSTGYFPRFTIRRTIFFSNEERRKIDTKKESESLSGQRLDSEYNPS